MNYFSKIRTWDVLNVLAKCQVFLSLWNVCQLVSNGSILAPDLTIAYKELYVLNTAL